MSVIDTHSLSALDIRHGDYTPPFVPGGGPGSPLTAPVPRRSKPADLEDEKVAWGYRARGAGQVPLALPPAIDDVTRQGSPTHYEWMMTDPVVSASVRALKLAILAGGMDLKATISAKPGAKELTPDETLAQEVVDFCWRCVERCKGWNAFLMDLLGAVAFGNKMAEKVFEVSPSGPDKGKLVWSRIKVKPRAVWQFVVDDAMNVLGIWYHRLDGTKAFLPREKVVILTWDPADADPRGTSVLRPAVEPHNLKHVLWPQLYKHFVQFGSAGLIGELAPEEGDHPAVDEHGDEIAGAAPVSAMRRMVQALEAYENGAAIAHANGGRLYTIPPQGEGEVFRGNVDLFNREMVQGILLQTRATSEAEHGSKADSETGQDIFGLLVDSGRQTLATALRDDGFRQLVALNYGQEVADEFTPLVTFGTQDQDRAAQWNAVANLMRSGYFGPSQLEEVDSMMGLPIRDAIADEEKAKEAADAAAAALPAPGGPPGEDGGGETDE
jgi:hypothetical protein